MDTLFPGTYLGGIKKDLSAEGRDGIYNIFEALRLQGFDEVRTDPYDLGHHHELHPRMESQQDLGRRSLPARILDDVEVHPVHEEPGKVRPGRESRALHLPAGIDDAVNHCLLHNLRKDLICTALRSTI